MDQLRIAKEIDPVQQRMSSADSVAQTSGNMLQEVWDHIKSNADTVVHGKGTTLQKLEFAGEAALAGAAIGTLPSAGLYTLIDYAKWGEAYLAENALTGLITSTLTGTAVGASVFVEPWHLPWETK